ncbi:MAG TPA: hypothetical protein VJU59_46235 [Paraburkholderia sp.]|uniref:hypothetical protein n=1 Tax=Paraburkholderia sp. TaxID=1926495 RepID=UPI002B4606AF|nr:hypothetical protein [Paraburkholderia sp.]HKR46989.1 hypothetical protein [Paraburkholderia sp.]HKT74765.1 hypothetical protein [Steroidobacteraceae bacterium]
MSAVLLAVFNDYTAADRVRIDLVRDGFPTDRVELTACCEPGRAGCEPAASLHDKFVQYFRTLFNREDERACAELLADQVDHGIATITVHPRGTVETARATEILEGGAAREILRHDLLNQKWEHAAASHEGPWVQNLWIENPHKAHCIYCRIFEHADRDGQ